MTGRLIVLILLVASDHQEEEVSADAATSPAYAAGNQRIQEAQDGHPFRCLLKNATIAHSSPASTPDASGYPRYTVATNRFQRAAPWSTSAPSYRRVGATEKKGTAFTFQQQQFQCRGERYVDYVREDDCKSTRTFDEIRCFGNCLPAYEMPMHQHYAKMWSRNKVVEWHCVDNKIRYFNVELVCNGGESRRKLMKFVKSCRCKRYQQQHNRVKLIGAAKEMLDQQMAEARKKNMRHLGVQ